MSDQVSDQVSDQMRDAWRGRVDALTIPQREALANALQREGPGAGRLTAFVVAGEGTSPDDEVLRTFVAASLPDHMIPSRFVLVDALPRTAAGKLDRAGLPRLQGTPLRAATDERVAVDAVSELEARLLAIWRDVLKLDELGVDDDFFEIGGDSLLSIRVIARAGREGIRLSPERFFERPTVRHMAVGVEAERRSRPVAPAHDAPATAPTGRAPLTPIQHWFLEAIPAHRDWWSQGYVLSLDPAVDQTALRAVVAALLGHHDALRLRLVREGTGWLQEFVADDGTVPLRVVAVPDTAPEARLASVRQEGERELMALRTDEGALFRFVLLEGGDGWRRLLLIGHHLVLDGVSWGMIMEDLATLMIQATSGGTLRLPARTAPARAWATALTQAAATPAVIATAAHWLPLAPVEGKPAGDPVVPGPDARPPRSALATTYNRDAALVSVVLDPEATRRLVHDAARRLESPVQALLLAACLLAWREWQGDEALTLDLEGHGRDTLGEALDVSRTVGWFTTVFPVRLALPRATGHQPTPAIDAVVHAVRATLDALPLRGASHGLLRYLTPDTSIRARLAAMPRPALLFNYLGAFDLAVPAAAGLRLTVESCGRTRDPDAARPYALEINARLQDGQLVVAIEYARTQHDASTMEPFARALRSALDAVSRAVPSQFDAAAIETIAALLDDLDGFDDQDDADDPSAGAPP